MTKDIDQLRKEKEREEENKIFQAINEQNKRARARKEREEQEERTRREREQKKEDRKALIQCIILILVIGLLLAGLLKLANNMDQKEYNTCRENGGSVEYCKKIIEW